LIPKQLKRHGMSRKTCAIADSAVLAIIDGYTREAGVRNLERSLADLIRKAAKKIVEDPTLGTVRITAKNIADFLGAVKILPDRIADTDEVGVVNGLAYTQSGGDMLRVEALVMEGSGKLELTGSLGDVMKESAHAALTFVRSIAAQYGIPSDFYQKKDIHIHVPEGAVPKDGPSAGVTMTTALVSALANIPVRRDVAMTGEVTLRGNVLAIGGRWSAGIGDGDSENNIESIRYAEDYAIVINAGTVECHGGCAAADGPAVGGGCRVVEHCHKLYHNSRLVIRGSWVQATKNTKSTDNLCDLCVLCG
jgi:ATP-dependent Lon protease